LLIGPNGAGKSNVLWALEMVRMLAFENLQLFVNERGGATYLLHYGPKKRRRRSTCVWSFRRKVARTSYPLAVPRPDSESFAWSELGA
jgi:predicted ATPase